jgi:hypothetical protein
MLACARGWFHRQIDVGCQTNPQAGRSRTFSDAEVQICLTMKVLFGMALRQTTGFVESLLELVELDW